MVDFFIAKQTSLHPFDFVRNFFLYFILENVRHCNAWWLDYIALTTSMSQNIKKYWRFQIQAYKAHKQERLPVTHCEVVRHCLVHRCLACQWPSMGQLYCLMHRCPGSTMLWPSIHGQLDHWFSCYPSCYMPVSITSSGHFVWEMYTLFLMCNVSVVIKRYWTHTDEDFDSYDQQHYNMHHTIKTTASINWCLAYCGWYSYQYIAGLL